MSLSLSLSLGEALRTRNRYAAELYLWPSAQNAESSFHFRSISETQINAAKLGIRERQLSLSPEKKKSFNISSAILLQRIRIYWREIFMVLSDQ